MPVDTRNSEYNTWLPIWTKTRDGIEGQEVIKKKDERYLPRLNGQDEYAYSSYLQRAQYTNYSGTQVSIMLGQLFRKEIITEKIDQEYLDNIDLQGTSFKYFSWDIADEVIEVNRVGILVDYNESMQRPFLTSYPTEQIINWKYRIINGVKQISMVVLEGTEETEDPTDPFESESEKIWKVLFLDAENIYRVIHYKKVNKNGKEEFIIVDEYTPIINDKPFNFIPFYIVTGSGISNIISKSSMTDFVNVNIGHYVNSADFENLAHWCSAKTIVANGWDDEKAFPVGGVAILDKDGDAKYLEADSNNLASDAQKHKEEQMSVMGSSAISGRGRYIASAETSRINNQGEHATLADISYSMSNSMTIIMTLLNEWAGDNENVVVKYNTDFETQGIDPNELASFSNTYTSRNMSWETYFHNLQKREVYKEGWTEKDEYKAIEEDKERNKEPEIIIEEAIADETKDNDDIEENESDISGQVEQAT